MENGENSKDWISVSTVSSVSGLSGAIWLVTNFLYSLISYLITFFVNISLDKTLFCLVLSLTLAVLLVPKIIHKFFPPIEDRTLKSFVIALNIILVISSANGLQSGFSAVSTNTGNIQMQTAQLLLFDSEPWLKPRSMTNSISSLKLEKEKITKELSLANKRIDSLNNFIGANTQLGEMDNFDNQENFLKKSMEALKLTNRSYKKLLEEKSDSIDLIVKSYYSIKSEYQNQFRINNSYDSLLRMLKLDIEREKLRQKQINDRLRKIDSLDRMNEH